MDPPDARSNPGAFADRLRGRLHAPSAAFDLERSSSEPPPGTTGIARGVARMRRLVRPRTRAHVARARIRHWREVGYSALPLRAVRVAARRFGHLIRRPGATGRQWIRTQIGTGRRRVSAYRDWYLRDRSSRSRTPPSPSAPAERDVEQLVSLFQDGPVVELTSGSGCLLAALAAVKVDAVGVSRDPDEVDRYRQSGLMAYCVPWRNYLRQLDDHCLAGLVASESVFGRATDLGEFFRQAHRLLVPGGVAALISPTPGSELAREVTSSHSRDIAARAGGLAVDSDPPVDWALVARQVRTT